MKTITAGVKEIEVRFPYSQGMVARIKEVPQGLWNPTEKMWTFPMTAFHATELRKFATEHQFMFDPKLTKMLTPKKNNIEVEGLRDYQNEAVTFFTNAGGRVLCADVMGLGKTIEVLGYIKYHNIRHIIIIAGASLLLNWADEIAKWLPNHTYQVIRTGKDTIDDSDIILASYSMLGINMDKFIRYNWELAIVDEVHNISNPKTLRYKAISQLKFNKIIGLSGTPFLNRPIELWGSLSVICPGAVRSYWSYAKRYCNAHQTPFGWDLSGHSNEEELKKVIAPYFIRRTKDDVATELPLLSRKFIPIEIDRKIYREVVIRVREADNNNKIAMVGKVRHVVGKLKIPASVEIARDILADDDQKVVLYAVHKDVVKELQIGLREFNALTVVGDNTQDERHDAIQKFQTDPKYRVMIISRAGGEGINLFMANHIIFVEREWNPGKEEQAESRLHRIGQRKNVTAHYLIAKDTIDEPVSHMIDSKRTVFADMIGTDDVESSITDSIYKLIKGD